MMKLIFEKLEEKSKSRDRLEESLRGIGRWPRDGIGESMCVATAASNRATSRGIAGRHHLYRQEDGNP